MTLTLRLHLPDRGDGIEPAAAANSLAEVAESIAEQIADSDGLVPTKLAGLTADTPGHARGSWGFEISPK